MAIKLNNTVTKAASSVEFVDLSEAPAKAKIVRKGYDVPAVKLDAKKVDQFVGELEQVATKDLPRVVSQAIPPGTKVAAGTVVDLVLAPRTKIPFSLFAGVHADFATLMLDAVDPMVADPEVKKTLLTYEFAEDVPEPEKAAVVAALGAVGVTVNEADPNRTFDKAFAAARGGMAFQG